jgi:hypothetical protein
LIQHEANRLKELQRLQNCNDLAISAHSDAPILSLSWRLADQRSKELGSLTSVFFYSVQHYYRLRFSLIISAMTTTRSRFIRNSNDWWLPICPTVIGRSPVNKSNML